MAPRWSARPGRSEAAACAWLGAEDVAQSEMVGKEAEVPAGRVVLFQMPIATATGTGKRLDPATKRENALD